MLQSLTNASSRTPESLFPQWNPGEPAKRWHMTLLWQRGAACRWHPCCPYGAPSLHNLSDWLSASLGEVKAGSESPLQQPGHPFRWQQCYRFSDIADATAWPYLSGCMREASWRRSLVLMGTSCGRGGGRRYNAEQAAPGVGGKKAAPFLSEMLASGRFRLCGGGYLLLRPDPAIRVPSVGAAIRTSAKLKSVPYVPAAAASRGNIGTSRDGRHIRHRFGDQSCIIGRCSH